MCQHTTHTHTAQTRAGHQHRHHQSELIGAIISTLNRLSMHKYDPYGSYLCIDKASGTWRRAGWLITGREHIVILNHQAKELINLSAFVSLW